MKKAVVLDKSIDEYYFEDEDVSCYLKNPSSSGWCYTNGVQIVESLLICP